ESTDGTATGARGSATQAVGHIVEECAAAHRSVGRIPVVQCPTGGKAARDRLVVEKHVVGEGEVAAGNKDTAAAEAFSQAVGDGQTGNGDGVALLDIEDAVGAVAVNGQLACPWPLDVQVLVDGQLVADQGDGVATEAGVEFDRIATAGLGDRVP